MDRARPGMFLAFWLISLVLFRDPLAELARLSINDERYTQLILIPILSAALVYLDRRHIFDHSAYSLRIGLPLLALGIALYYMLGTGTPTSQYTLSVQVFCIVVIWAAGFALFFGSHASRAAAFPFGFLSLMIPIPAAQLGTMVAALQDGSAEVSSMLFRLIGVPNFREGVYFLLPGIQIKIAEQCSGIRSSQALFLVCVLAGYIFLRSGWKTILIALLTLPLTIFKNAIRIVTLSTLAVYVNRDFLFGNLHHYGGLVFSLLDLFAVIPFILLRPKLQTRPLES